MDKTNFLFNISKYHQKSEVLKAAAEEDLLERTSAITLIHNNPVFPMFFWANNGRIWVFKSAGQYWSQLKIPRASRNKH